MLQYLIKRLIMMVPLLIGITLISFMVIHLAPGEPAGLQMEMAPKVTKEARERIRAYYGLDKPLYVQYLTWLKKFVSLDFGNSFSPDGRKVTDKIVERLPITIMINVLSLALIFIVAIPLGVLSATHQDAFIDKATTVFVFIGFAIPTFWLALLLMMLFGVHLGWLPISGIRSMDYENMTLMGQVIDRFKHLLMPIFLAAFGGLAGLSRYMRGSMLEVLRQDYVVTARAKGLPEGQVIYKHVLRNALLPVITILGLSVPDLIGGSVIFETIFAIPGMGQLFYASVMARDYPVIMGIVVIGAILTLVGNLLADLSYALADPRIRRS
ncbi:MAG TPA: ABC transporter permease [Thermodesulfobacteriota bacterium]|nr:ABC transporter permease [Thermodesulfobacteriota bacterium]